MLVQAAWPNDGHQHGTGLQWPVKIQRSKASSSSDEEVLRRRAA